MRRQRLDEPAIPYMFQAGAIPQMDIAVRATGDPEMLRDAIRALMHDLDPAAPPYGIVTGEQRLAQTVALRRISDDAAGRIGGDGVDAGSNRRLRHRPSLGRGAPTGDRHPHSTRCKCVNRCAHGACHRTVAGGDGARDMTSRIAGPEWRMLYVDFSTKPARSTR